jgi:3-methyladenine DNA glycosylase/8-oxoguanine DNA glycosylase
VCWVSVPWSAPACISSPTDANPAHQPPLLVASRSRYRATHVAKQARGIGRDTMIDATFASGGVDHHQTLRHLAMLPGDPTVRLSANRLERATVTPAGAGTLIATWNPAIDEVIVQCHGAGAQWLMERAPGLLGLDDNPVGFAPTTEPLRTLAARHAGDRVMRTGTLWHDLIWLIVQQRVQSVDAATQWRRLVRALGDTAPGDTDLLTPPTPDRLAGMAYHEFHPFGIERRRADHLRRAAQHVQRHGFHATEPTEKSLARLGSVNGIGPWTLTSLAAFTLGDPDAVIVGDFGIPSMVAWVLAGERRADDQRMLELLEPYRPHRYRAMKLAFAAGSLPPRRAPRHARIDIARR